MNKQQVKGMANEASGEIKKKIGQATDNTSLEVRGHAQDLKGEAQQKVGNAREELKETDRELAAREERERQLKRTDR